MKKIILALAIVTSTSAFADTARTTVGSFKGTLTIESSILDIKNIEVEVVNQFCNFWGTTCAGGPSDGQSLAIITSESADGKTITLAHEGESEVSSIKVGNRFSSCKVNLIVDAINAEGRSLRGTKNLAWINDKKVCADKAKMTQTVRENLKNTLSLADGGIYIKIK